MSQDTSSLNDVEIRLVDAWNVEEIAGLYRAAGWWKDTYEVAGIGPLMKGSLAFAVAVDPGTGLLAGMGRAISDGVSDAYIQDLVVLPRYRRGGVGRRLVTTLVNACHARGVLWIGLIAEPGSASFYESLGFRVMPGHVPMIYSRQD
ncbi:MAG TPA: GNAT family N-acetyltransferase [Methanocella sp.]|nr:GNAT family N-acetyltransferase [Methanocella sp.]